MRALSIFISFLCPLSIIGQPLFDGQSIPKWEIRASIGESVNKLSFSNLQETLDKTSGLTFVGPLFDTHKPNLPVLSRTFAGELLIWLNTKQGISLEYKNAFRGAKSPNFFLIKGRDDPSSYPIGYGGTSYEIKMGTHRIVTFYHHKLHVKKKLVPVWRIGIGMDILNWISIQDFIIERDTGVKRVGCCVVDGRLFAQNSGIEKLVDNLSSGLMRIGLSSGLRLEYSVSKKISIAANSEVEIFSPLLRPNNQPFLLDGMHYGAGIYFDVSYKLGELKK